MNSINTPGYYYRFISKAEYRALLKGEIIKSPNYEEGVIHIFPEVSETFFSEDSVEKSPLNYERQLAAETLRLLEVEEMMDYLTGVTAESFLVKLKIYPDQILGTKFGHYYHTDTQDLVLKEYLITEYSLKNVDTIFSGNFYSWNNIQEIYPTNIEE